VWLIVVGTEPGLQAGVVVPGALYKTKRVYQQLGFFLLRIYKIHRNGVIASC